jgi:hypothetical protein
MNDLRSLYRFFNRILCALTGHQMWIGHYGLECGCGKFFKDR